MKNFLTLFSIFFMISMNITVHSKLNYVPTEKKPVTDSVHGFEITDPYRWLEDKDNPVVKDWSKKQHQFTIDYIRKNEKEIPGLKDEIRNYLDRDYRGAPFFAGLREFFYARNKGEQQNKLYTIIDDKEKLIFK